MHWIWFPLTWCHMHRKGNTNLQLWSFVKEIKGLFWFLALREQHSWWESQRAALLRVFSVLMILKINFLVNFIWFFINTFTSGKYVEYCEFVFSKNIAKSVTTQLVNLLATFCWTLATSLLIHFTSTCSRCIFWNEKRPFANLGLQHFS